jgi:hypothetical protein
MPSAFIPTATKPGDQPREKGQSALKHFPASTIRHPQRDARADDGMKRANITHLVDGLFTNWRTVRD